MSSLVLYLQKTIIINVISQVGSCMNISFACHHANTCTRNAYICNWYNKTVEAHTFFIWHPQLEVWVKSSSSKVINNKLV